MSAPLVSVVIATWNTGKYLPETLASALAQTYPNLEVIVVDDGSTDGTREAIAEFLPRIRYEPRPHRGLPAARNEGIRLAEGAYVAFLDADDLWHPAKIAVQVEIAKRHPEAGMIACNGVQFSDDGIIEDTLLYGLLRRALDSATTGEVAGDFHRGLIAGSFIVTPGQVLIPRGVFQEIGPFADIRSQDYEYFLRISSRYPIVLHSHSHVRYRVRPDSVCRSGDPRYLALRRQLRALRLLIAHRRRCRPEDRPVLEARIRELLLSLEGGLMTQGREGERYAATSQLLTVFRLRPWPPTVLLYVAGVWSPSATFQLGARLARRFRGNP